MANGHYGLNDPTWWKYYGHPDNILFDGIENIFNTLPPFRTIHSRIPTHYLLFLIVPYNILFRNNNIILYYETFLKWIQYNTINSNL